MKNKYYRNESAQTVPKKPQLLHLFIYHRHKEILRVTVKSTDTVRELLDKIKKSLIDYDIIGLASVEHFYTLDYALMNPNMKLHGLRNLQKLQIIERDLVADQSTPTLQDFHFVALLGSGISASVFLVRHCANAKLYALKQIKKQYFKDFKTMEGVLREKKILSEMVKGLPFATELVTSFESQKHLNFLLEFYPGGQFFYHLTKIKLSEDDAKKCFAQIVLGMEQLHQKKILYRDLKPQNIMIDFDGHLRIGDFGLCRINLDPQDHAMTQCGSPEYMAAEVVGHEAYGYPADFYTMGAIMFEMVRTVPPYYGDSGPPNYEGTTDGFRDLVEALINKDPSYRLSSMTALKQYKWLRGIDWEKVRSKEYTMPIRLNLYQNYIHPQFTSEEIDSEQLKYQEKYDRLFNMFFYMSDNKDGFASYYPKAFPLKVKMSAKNSAKFQHKNRRQTDTLSQGSASSRGTNKSTKREIANKFKRKATDKPNIYTTPFERIPTKKKTEVSSKSVSVSKRDKSKGKKIKESTQLQTMRRKPSPIRFNKLMSVKSTGKLKTEYVREIERTSKSKRKQFI